MEEQNNNHQGNGAQRISVRPGNFVPPPGGGANAAGDPHRGQGKNRRRNRGDHRPSGAGSGQNPQNRQNPQNMQNSQNGQGAGNGQNPQNGQGGQNRRNGARPNGQNRQNPQNRRDDRNRGAETAQNGQNGQNGQNRRDGDGQNGQNGQNRRDGGGKNRGQNRRDERGRQNANAQGERADRAAVGGQNPQNAAKAPQGQKPRKGNDRQAKAGNAPHLSEILQRELDEEFSTPMLSSYRSPAKARVKEETVEDTHEFEVDIATAAYLVEDIPTGIPAPGEKAVEVIGVRFRRAGKVYFFAPDGLRFAIGDSTIVDTARGAELGQVVMLNRRIAEKEIVQPLRHVLRKATAEDLARDEENHRQEEAALKICAEKIAAHKLDMRLVDAQYAFDNSKLLFYFTSENRVDFRELVRDLAGVFHTRIELRQIGIRDESRLIGGLGMCGRPFCCSTFLSDFGQVSVKMAKEQGLSINATKISGCCGRLMCCLRYEYETYRAEAKITPKKDTVVQTPDGTGVVVESTPLSGLLKVRVEGLPEEDAVHVYHRDDVTPVGKPKGKNAGQSPDCGQAPDCGQTPDCGQASETAKGAVTEGSEAADGIGITAPDGAAE